MVSGPLYHFSSDMPCKSCALTNERSAFGVRKPGGECLMTKIERGDVDARTVTAPRYTFCKKCRLSVCVDCWDCVTLELEKLVASTRGLMMHDVYHVSCSCVHTARSVVHDALPRISI